MTDPPIRCAPDQHGGDAAIIVEVIDTGGPWASTGARCLRCGFRTVSIIDDNGQDQTDRFVTASYPSTWARWEKEGLPT